MLKQQQQSIEELKNEIISSNYPIFEVTDRHSYRSTDHLIGRMYLINKMDYGFHIYFIHEPNVNKLAGVNGIVTEMYYDLRNKIYWIKRNNKEVKFSVRNVDSIFPSSSSSSKRSDVFEFLSTEKNSGMYNKAMNYLGAMGTEISEMFGRFFHRLITEHSYFEILHKAGFDLNSNNLRIVNKNGTTPIEILGINKTRWKIFTKYKLPISILGRDSSKEDADQKMINYLAYIKTLEDEFGIDKLDSFFRFESDYIYTGEDGGNYYSRSAILIAERYNLPIKNFLRYIYFECDVSQGLDAYTAIEQYKDYIRMTSEMGYERFDRYPKFLRTAHDIASRNYKIKLNEIELRQWEQAYERNNEYRYSYKDYTIFPPKETSDLVREGNVLSHCVGSYVHKVRKGTSIILFLRLKEDVETPLVTIEVQGKRINQAYGKMNYPPTEEQKEIIRKFAEKFEITYNK